MHLFREGLPYKLLACGGLARVHELLQAGWHSLWPLSHTLPGPILNDSTNQPLGVVHSNKWTTQLPGTHTFPHSP
jgi:hypothetical protein